jgi:hypothetical protein
MKIRDEIEGSKLWTQVGGETLSFIILLNEEIRIGKVNISCN